MGGFKLTITFGDGTNEIVSESVGVWKNGANSFTVELPVSRKIVRVELWDSIWIDADSGNDIYIVK